MDELYFEKKRRPVRLKFLLWSGVFRVICGALVGAFYFVLNSAFFKVKGFEVSDSRYTPNDTLLAALNADMIGRSRLLSVLGPDNILFWEFGEKPEALSNLPLVARISVKTNLTAGKVSEKAVVRDFSGIWGLSAVGADC